MSARWRANGPSDLFCTAPNRVASVGRYAALTLLVAGGLTFVVRLAEFPYRPRPTDDLAWTLAVRGSSSYPSGHVVYSVLVFGLLAYLASRHPPRFWLRAVMVCLPAIIVIAMGPARIIDKDHWPADVAGGYLISLPLLMGVIWAHAHLPAWLGRRAPRVYSLLGGEPPG